MLCAVHGGHCTNKSLSNLKSYPLEVLPCLVVYFPLTSALGESVWKSCTVHLLCGVLCSAALPVFSSEDVFSLHPVFLNVLAFGGHYRGLQHLFPASGEASAP